MKEAFTNPASAYIKLGLHNPISVYDCLSFRRMTITTDATVSTHQ